MLQKIKDWTKKIDALSGLQLFQLSRFAGLSLVGIVLARSNYSKAEIAQYETVLWLSSFATFFWLNSIVQVFLANFEKQQDSEKKTFTFRFAFSLQILSISTALVLWLITQNIYAALFLLFQTPASLNEYILFVNHERKKLINYVLFNFITFLLIGFYVYFLKSDIDEIAAILVLMAFAKWCYGVFILSRFALPSFRLIEPALWKSSTYLAIGFIFSGSAEYIDGWLVKHYFESSVFTEFRFGSRELPLFATLAATLSNASIPLLSSNLKDGLAKLKADSLKYMHFMFPLAILIVLSAPFIFKVVYGEAYIVSGKVFSLMILLLIPRLVFPQAVYHALNLQKTLVRISLAELLINIAASFVLMQFFGWQGIVAGTVIAFALEKLLLAFYLRQKHAIYPSDYLDLKWWAIYSTALIAAVWVQYVLF
jgi:O-antigen/teichoic acid export membrane protein